MRQDECQNTQYWNKATEFLYIYVTVSLENIWLVSLRAVFSVETWWCVALMGLSAGWDWQEAFEACITLWLACMLHWACAENVCQRGKRGLKGVCFSPGRPIWLSANQEDPLWNLFCCPPSRDNDGWHFIPPHQHSHSIRSLVHIGAALLTSFLAQTGILIW